MKHRSALEWSLSGLRDAGCHADLETVARFDSGFNTATITVPYVYVPLRFTWTVKFFGLGMTATENAGLLYYGKPIIGTSFNDFWDLEPQGWTVVRVAGITDNFAAKIMAVSAVPPPPSINVTLSGGNLVVSWPPGLNNMWLESKPALGSGIWEPALPLPLRVGDVFRQPFRSRKGIESFG